MSAQRRKTRFVCVSDTHNYTFKLPKGDVLIHAGDLTNQGSPSELQKTVKWLEDADFEAKIVVGGNHDLTLDGGFYLGHDSPQDYETIQKRRSTHSSCLDLFKASKTLTYLFHDAAEIRLQSLDGPHTMFKIFGSPYSPRDGAWAFNYETPREPEAPCRDAHAAIDDHGLTSLWDGIPIDSHIVVTHTPPRNHRDTPFTRLDRPRGCEALRRALWRVRPLLAVCGHIHDGRGANIVTWDSSNSRYKESKTREWVDPGAGNNKQSLIDLTGRTGSPLDNDGSFTNGCRVYGLEEDGKQGNIGNTKEGSRNETCIVNAAIMKSKYPHIGGKKYNKPIIVDVMLPVWDEGDESR